MAELRDSTRPGFALSACSLVMSSGSPPAAPAAHDRTAEPLPAFDRCSKTGALSEANAAGVAICGSIAAPAALSNCGLGPVPD